MDRKPYTCKSFLSCSSGSGYHVITWHGHSVGFALGASSPKQIFDLHGAQIHNITNSVRSALAAMDLASLKEAAANLTLYDLKAGVRKVQNGTPPFAPTVLSLSSRLFSCDELHGDGGQSEGSYK